jgi:hypothetical protein
MLLQTINAIAATTTIAAAILVASNWSPAVMVWGFSVFVVASLAWIASGWIDDKPSLIIQNVILFFVNIAGIWRWLPRAAKDTPP